MAGSTLDQIYFKWGRFGEPVSRSVRGTRVSLIGHWMTKMNLMRSLLAGIAIALSCGQAVAADCNGSNYCAGPAFVVFFDSRLSDDHNQVLFRLEGEINVSCTYIYNRDRWFSVRKDHPHYDHIVSILTISVATRRWVGVGLPTSGACEALYVGLY